MSTTSIEWATDVWNPFTGCDRVSPGCANCYAADQAARNQRMERVRAEQARAKGKEPAPLRYQNDGDPKSSGPGFAFTVQWDRLERPPKWKPGARVFVNSMSDVFHEEAPYRAICRIYEIAAEQPAVNFLILTKRPERMKEVVERIGWDDEDPNTPGLPTWSDSGLPNVWLGVSIENRRFVHRADLLRETPAAVRFISAEPLLGPLVGLQAEYGSVSRLCAECGKRYLPQHTHRLGRGVNARWVCGNCHGNRPAPLLDRQEPLDLTDIDWLIAGAESGPKRRRFDEQWVRDLRDACLAKCPIRSYEHHCQAHRGDRPAFFYKQGSAHKPGQHRELDGRTWDEFPVSPAAERTAA